MDESNEDPRLPHRRNPNKSVSVDQLAEFGVLYWKLNPTIYENDEELAKIREDRGYNYMVIFYFFLLNFNSFYFVFCN